MSATGGRLQPPYFSRRSPLSRLQSSAALVGGNHDGQIVRPLILLRSALRSHSFDPQAVAEPDIVDYLAQLSFELSCRGKVDCH